MGVNCVGPLRLAFLLCSYIPVIIIATVPCICWERNNKKVLNCKKWVGGWIFTPEPVGGAYSALPDPLTGFWSSAHAHTHTPPPLSQLPRSTSEEGTSHDSDVTITSSSKLAVLNKDQINHT